MKRTGTDRALCQQMLATHRGLLTQEAEDILAHDDTRLDVRVGRFSTFLFENTTLGKALGVSQRRAMSDDCVLVSTSSDAPPVWRTGYKP